MYNETLPGRQLSCWLAAALIPTVIQRTAGSPWLALLISATVCLLAVCLRWYCPVHHGGKVIALLQWVLIVLVLGTVCKASVSSWPRGGHKAVGVFLLVLAAWSAWKGPSAAARVGCVLFWFVLVLYLVLLGAGLKQVQLRWLLPVKGDADALGCVLLLTPAAAAIHLNKRERCNPRLLLIGLFALAASLVTSGVLSPELAGKYELPFYEMIRSLTVKGSARRFEAVLSAAMTVGWFALMSLYLTVAGKWAQALNSGWGRGGIIAAALASVGLLLWELHMGGLFLLIAATVFWVLLPILAQGIDKIKKS